MSSSSGSPVVPRAAHPVSIACLMLSALAASAHAQDETSTQDGGLWAIGLGAQADDESNSSKLLSFNWGVSENTWLSFAATESRAPEDGADIVADGLYTSVEHRFGLVGLMFNAERWGDPDALESTDVGAGMYLQNERFRLAFGLERRAIEIPFTITGPLGGTFSRTAEVDADGTELSLRVQLGEQWQLYARALTYDYSRNLAVLPRIDRLNLLSASALMLANSLVDEHAAFGVEWETPGRKVLSLGYGADESAVDGTELESFDVALLFPVAGRVDLEINVGHGRSDLLGSGLYGGVLLLIYGGR